MNSPLEVLVHSPTGFQSTNDISTDFSNQYDPNSEKFYYLIQVLDSQNNLERSKLEVLEVQ